MMMVRMGMMAQGSWKEKGEVKNAFSGDSLIPPVSPLEKGGGLNGMLCFDERFYGKL